jgi:hypothetical protein
MGVGMKLHTLSDETRKLLARAVSVEVVPVRNISDCIVQVDDPDDATQWGVYVRIPDRDGDEVMYLAQHIADCTTQDDAEAVAAIISSLVIARPGNESTAAAIMACVDPDSITDRATEAIEGISALFEHIADVSHNMERLVIGMTEGWGVDVDWYIATEHVGRAISKSLEDHFCLPSDALKLAEQGVIEGIKFENRMSERDARRLLNGAGDAVAQGEESRREITQSAEDAGIHV